MPMRLSARPDGYGFLYGRLVDGERSHEVNVLPPKAEWAGDIVLEGYAPHDTDWILYVDGEEIARVRQRQDLDTISPQQLTR